MTTGLALTIAFVSASLATGTGLETAYGVAAAVNAHSNVVRCEVITEAQTISCSVDESIGASDARKFADRLTVIAHENGLPGDWAIAVRREW